MAITISKRVFSSSTDGQSIPISATAGATTILIHTGLTGTQSMDEVYLYAQNNFSQAAEVILEIGVSTTNIHVAAIIPPREGPQLVLPGTLLMGSATAPTIRAYVGLNASGSLVASAGVVSVLGYVNRITQT